MTAPYRRAGRIIKSHGTHGEVVVGIDSGLSFHDLAGLHVWVVPPVERVRPFTIIEARQGPKGAIVTFEGVETAAEAHTLAGRWLLAHTESLPVPGPEATDIIGYAVSDLTRGRLGHVTDVIITGANDVLVVDDGPFGQVLLPVIEQVIREVDHDGRSIVVELLDGLIDEEAHA